MLERILVPLDGSNFAERALKPALDIARAVNGQLILLRSVVFTPTALPDFAGEYEWFWDETAIGNARVEATEYLQMVQKKVAHPDLTVHTEVMEGDEAVTIVDVATEMGVDLIVMSTHGRSGLTRWALGSVTEKVLHSAFCPVLVVRIAGPISKIVITLDGSELAERALQPGLAVARNLEASVTLLRVNQLAAISREESVQMEWQVGKEPDEASLKNINGAIEAYLDDVAGRYQHRLGREMETAVINGPPAQSILKFAASCQADLVVMSTHGRTGLQRWIYGSVTTKVLRGAACSMLIVRPPTHRLGNQAQTR